MTVQPGLCQTWSEPQIVGFLMHRLNYSFQKAISMSVREQSLQIWPHQIEKVKQLYNQIMVRHGVMLVGPTGGGKTTVRSILQRALVLLPTITAQDDKQEEGGKGKAVFVVSWIISKPEICSNLQSDYGPAWCWWALQAVERLHSESLGVAVDSNSSR